MVGLVKGGTDRGGGWGRKRWHFSGSSGSWGTGDFEENVPGPTSRMRWAGLRGCRKLRARAGHLPTPLAFCSKFTCKLKRERETAAKPGLEQGGVQEKGPQICVGGSIPCLAARGNVWPEPPRPLLRPKDISPHVARGPAGGFPDPAAARLHRLWPCPPVQPSRYWLHRPGSTRRGN